MALVYRLMPSLNFERISNISKYNIRKNHTNFLTRFGWGTHGNYVSCVRVKSPYAKTTK